MESNKYFSKEVDKYTKILTNFIKKQPKKKILKMRSKKKVLPSSNNSVLRYTQLEQMANNLKNKNFETEKRQRDGLYLAQKENRKKRKYLRDSYGPQSSITSRSIKKKLRKADTEFMKESLNMNLMKSRNDMANDKMITYKKKFLNMTKKLNDQLHSRLVSRSDKIQKVVLSKNNSDPITRTPFKNGEIILSTGKPGQYFSLNSFENLLKRQKTRQYVSNNTGVRTVGEIKSLAKNNKSKNVIVYKKNPLNRQQIQAKNVKFVRVVINKK
tara:strand:+ start:66 stop:875 length:810 start_codon:yes stop_codon:yes gene_type:complete